MALMTLSVVFFAGSRHRTVYDPLIIFMAVETYAYLACWLWARGSGLFRARAESASKGPSSPQDNSSS